LGRVFLQKKDGTLGYKQANLLCRQ
jgi:hypothetical protein